MAAKWIKVVVAQGYSFYLETGSNNVALANLELTVGTRLATA